MHDTGHTNPRLAALRHHNAKGENKSRCRKKKEARKTFVYCCIIVQHSNKILMRTAARRASHIFFIVLANASSDTACCMCLPALQCTIPGAFHISLRNVEDECILIEKFA